VAGPFAFRRHINSDDVLNSIGDDLRGHMSTRGIKQDALASIRTQAAEAR
jgi:hypothetical protein